jgi:hypothetical protein
MNCNTSTWGVIARVSMTSTCQHDFHDFGHRDFDYPSKRKLRASRHEFAAMQRSYRGVLRLPGAPGLLCQKRSVDSLRNHFWSRSGTLGDGYPVDRTLKIKTYFAMTTARTAILAVRMTSP